MSRKEELLGLVRTLQKAVVLEEDALDAAIASGSAEGMRSSFHELARLRARLSEAERGAGEAE